MQHTIPLDRVRSLADRLESESLNPALPEHERLSLARQSEHARNAVALGEQELDLATNPYPLEHILDEKPLLSIRGAMYGLLFELLCVLAGLAIFLGIVWG